MTRSIVVANQKGGVGKTTTVANLGAALTAMGQRVLLIDLDPQAALTATYGYDPYNLPLSMYSVLMSDTTSLARVIRPAGVKGMMAIAPGSVDLASAELKLVNAENRAYRLKRAIDQNHIPFDFILLDTPPSLGLLTLNGLVGVTEVLVPVQCHYLAMRGVRALMETIWRVKRRLNPALRLLGLLPTMYDENSIHSREVVTELRAVFGPKLFDVPVPAAIQFAEVAVAQQSLIEYDPDYEGVAPYWKLAEAVLKNDPGL